MVTNKALTANLKMMKEALEMTSSAVLVSWVPQQHDMGLIGNLLQSLYIGAKCVLMSPASFVQTPVKWLKAISKYKGTNAGSPDFGYALCASKIKDDEIKGLDLSSWKMAVNAAERIRHHTINNFTKKFEKVGFDPKVFFPAYGLAEATLFVSGGRPGEHLRFLDVSQKKLRENGHIYRTRSRTSIKIASSGRVHPDQKVIIVDPKTREQKKPFETGEIWISGDNVAAGYWNHKELTRETFKAALANKNDKTVFLRTGDLGFIHEGHLYVTGRLKEMIIMDGSNHCPQDIESLVQGTDEWIQDDAVAAFSIEKSDQETLAIVAELKRQCPEGQRKALCGKIREAIFDEYSLFVDTVALIKNMSLPKTTSGKIQRNLCRKKLLEGSLQIIYREERNKFLLDISRFSLTKKEILNELPQKRSTLILNALLSVFGHHHDKDTLKNCPLRSLGVNYLKAAEFAMLIQKHLQVQVSFAEIFSSMSLKKFAEYLADIFDAFDEEINRSDLRRPIPMKKTQVCEHYPLSFGQKSLWFFQNSNPENAAYNLSLAVQMEGELRLSKLKKACFQLVSKYPTLNMRFKISTKGLEQTPVKIKETDLRLSARKNSELKSYRNTKKNRRSGQCTF